MEDTKITETNKISQNYSTRHKIIAKNPKYFRINLGNAKTIEANKMFENYFRKQKKSLKTIVLVLVWKEKFTKINKTFCKIILKNKNY